MNKWMVVATAGLLSACAAQFPYKRPMQESYQPAIKDLQVYTYAEERGVGVGFLARDSNAALPQSNLLVALVDAGINQATYQRGATLANELTKGFDLVSTERQLQAALASNLRDVPWMSPRAEVKHMSIEQRRDVSRFEEPTVMAVRLNYVMSSDLAHLYLIADVQIISKNLQYAGVYPNEARFLEGVATERQKALKNAKRDHRPKPKNLPEDTRAQLYRNVFTFISAEIPVAATIKAAANERITAIRARYKDARGRLTQDRNKILQMNRELHAAEPWEREQLIQFWIANEGAELKRSMSEGVQALSQLLARDLQDTQVPASYGQATDKVELIADGSRRIVRIAHGYSAGNYVSEPVPAPARRWDTIAYGDEPAARE